MTSLDVSVIALYLAAMLGLSAWLSRRQKGVDEYYLGGRRLSAFAVGVSTLATQSSAISFISIPAFVALRPNGGMRFLQYEIALPLSMAALALWLIPALRAAGVMTIYEYLELRFDTRVRRAVAALFLLGRGLATGVALYATGLVLEACLDLPLAAALLLLGAVTVVYDLLGGLTAVVYSDVIQMGVLLVALAACTYFIAAGVGGPVEALRQFPAERWAAFATPEGAPDTVLSYVLGGAFLYASYYGCDQSQAQRLLATRSVADTQKALLLNGVGRFPLVLGYCALGVAAAAALADSPQLRAALGERPSDVLVPQLVREALPSGLRGLVLAGLLAAAMSSLDSALNALSASVARDFAGRAGHSVWAARLWTLGWGALITAFAFVVGDISETVIEAINKVGSAVYGPVLAVFVLSRLARRPRSGAVLAGLGSGFAVNVLLWLTAPSLHFLWWNPIGCALTLTVAWAAPGRIEPRDELPLPAVESGLPSHVIVAWLGGGLAVILAVMALLHSLAS